MISSKVINENKKEDKENEEIKTQNTQNTQQSQITSPSTIILEEFMSHFDQLLSQIKYNLQSFNKKCDSMDRCFGNVLLLKSNKPFDEEENHEDEIQKQIDELYSEYNPNSINKKQNKKKNNKENLKITSKELNNIEKMFEDMNGKKKKKKNEMNLIEKKRKQGRAPYKYMYEIDKILKGGKIKDEEKYEKKNKKNKINKNEKAIKLDDNDDDDEQFIDHIILDKKIEKYTQFKEMLKKFEESKKDDAISDYENIDDDLDLDFDD